MSKRNIILIILSAILLIYVGIDYADYYKHNYDVTGFNFICNESVCEVRHKKLSGEIKYTDKIDISKIEKFSSRLEKIPRTNGQGLVIYADCKDGTSFRFSPIYVRPSRYLDSELLDRLNSLIEIKPIDINFSFPH